MKIAMYSPSWPPGDANGVVTYLSHIVPELRSRGHEVFILTPICRLEDPYTIDLQQFSERSPLWLRALYKASPSTAHYIEISQRLVRAVQYAIKRHGIEILEIEESFGISKAVSDLKIIPVVVRLHGPWFLNKREPNADDSKREARERDAISAADIVTSPSLYVQEATIKNYSFGEKQRFIYLPNPISAPKEQWQLSTCNNLLFVGRFDAIKGGDVVVKSFGLLAEQHPTLTLTFVGPDSGVDGVKCGEFASQHLPPSVVSRITFTGSIAQSDIAAMRLKSFATVFASRVEIFGYTLLEAMAAGCPIVASSAGGAAELIEGCAIEATPGDARSLAEGIKCLLDDPVKAAALGAKARSKSELYSSKSVATHMIDNYQQIMPNSQSLNYYS
jgi:glycosyltransferase involved in cell wall biosynthesis